MKNALQISQKIWPLPFQPKLDDAQTQEPVKRQRRKTRDGGRSTFTGKTWLKVVIVALLVILMAVGLLYQAGFIKTHRMKPADPVRPSVAESMPQPLQETAPLQPAAGSPAVVPPAPTEKQAASAPPQNDPTKPYSIQIKAVPSAEEAKQIVESLNTKGDDAFSKIVTIKGRGKWHRIFIGHYADQR